MIDSAGIERAHKRRALTRRRALAGALLLLAAAAFVILQVMPHSFASRLASAAAEAALVGGLADWFAVTAIFRRPLGLPIPHTALIPKRKAEIGEALGAFVRDHFLAPEVVVGRLRRDNRAIQFARWLDSPAAADFSAQRAAALIPMLIEQWADDSFRERIAAGVVAVLRRIDPAPLLNGGIDALLASGKHVLLLDAGVELLLPSLSAFEPALLEKISTQTGRFFPAYFDRKIGESMMRGIAQWLVAVASEGTAERVQAEAWLRGLLLSLREAPGYPALVAELRAAIFDNQAFRALATEAFAELRREAEADLGGSAPRLPLLIGRAVREAGRMLAQSPALQEYVNGAVERLVLDYIAPWREAIALFIADVVSSWDTATVVELIELEAGSDLQYIRINGTLVGAMIGVMLFLISSLF